MKKAKIVLIVSLLVFIGLLLYYTISLNKKAEENQPVSLREEFQREYNESKGNGS